MSLGIMNGAKGSLFVVHKSAFLVYHTVMSKTSPSLLGDYRIFVGAFPTGALAEQIQAIRQQYDPVTACITPPHVTIAGTYWRSGPPTLKNESLLIARLHEVNFAPFTLELGGIKTFADKVLYLHAQTTPPLLTVRQQLLQVMGHDKHQAFVPHLTLAMRLNPTDIQTMKMELEQTHWHTHRPIAPITELWLMQRGAKDPVWRRIATFELAV